VDIEKKRGVWHSAPCPAKQFEYVEINDAPRDISSRDHRNCVGRRQNCIAFPRHTAPRLNQAHVSHARENTMQKRTPTIFAMAFVPFIATAGGTHGVALAESECIESPGPQTPKNGHWYFRSDRTTGRKCWYLSDSTTTPRDPAAPRGQGNTASTSTLTSRLTGLLGSFAGSAATATPPSSTVGESRTSTANVATAPRNVNSVRSDQTDVAADSADERTGKRTAQPAKRDALFEEFLRWNERQQDVSRSTMPGLSP
jgi:hypothetical protein